MTDTTKALNLPELPNVALQMGSMFGNGLAEYYTAEQMREYAIAAIEASRATAAQEVSDQEIFALSDKYIRMTPDHRLLYDDGLLQFARALLAAAPKVPDGWKLVPVEPTEEMKTAGAKAILDNGSVGAFDVLVTDAWFAYECMLSAAPSAPQAELTYPQPKL